MVESNPNVPVINLQQPLNIKLKDREWIKNNKTTAVKFKVMLPIRDTPQI